ncbi:MAG: hypothetical protein AAB265_01575 [candidate division NC10 bacterium]
MGRTQLEGVVRVLVRGLALAGESASQRGQRLRAGQAGIQLAGSPGRAERALRAGCGVALAALCPRAPVAPVRDVR